VPLPATPELQLNQRVVSAVGNGPILARSTGLHTFLFYANTTNFCSAPAMSDWAAAMVMAETTISAGQSKPHQ
jgi:hypothetical protein